jgi:hypothetical protein
MKATPHLLQRKKASQEVTKNIAHFPSQLNAFLEKIIIIKA